MTGGGQPRVIAVPELDAAVREAIKSGYAVVGYSAFDGGPPRRRDARAHALEIGAHLVLVRSRYPPTFADARSSEVVSTALATDIVAMPYADATSDYLAVFMARRRPGALAAELAELDADARERIQAQLAEVGFPPWTRVGVEVVEVVQDGPASLADLQAGDVILTIDGECACGIPEAARLIAKSARETIVVRVVRGGAVLERTVELDP